MDRIWSVCSVWCNWGLFVHIHLEYGPSLLRRGLLFPPCFWCLRRAKLITCWLQRCSWRTQWHECCRYANVPARKCIRLCLRMSLCSMKALPCRQGKYCWAFIEFNALHLHWHTSYSAEVVDTAAESRNRRLTMGSIEQLTHTQFQLPSGVWGNHRSRHVPLQLETVAAFLWCHCRQNR